MKKTGQCPLLTRERATTMRCEGCVRPTWAEYRLAGRAASSGGARSGGAGVARVSGSDGPLLLGVRPEVLLELAGEFDESRREAHILVNRIAVIVARNDFRTPLIRHGGGNFVQSSAQQVGNQGFDRLPGKQFGQGV